MSEDREMFARLRVGNGGVGCLYSVVTHPAKFVHILNGNQQHY